MKYFDETELSRLYNNESDFAKKHIFPPVTEELIERAEAFMGYKLPDSYRELLSYQNGGVISDEINESWLSAIYGISPDPKVFFGLEAMFDNWKEEWEYPDIGIPFGETESAGHDMYYMDFRVKDENGEPRIVRIDNEMNNEIFVVAKNLPEFIELILRNEPLDEEATGEGGLANYVPPEPEKKKKKSFFEKLFG